MNIDGIWNPPLRKFGVFAVNLHNINNSELRIKKRSPKKHHKTTLMSAVRFVRNAVFYGKF